MRCPIRRVGRMPAKHAIHDLANCLIFRAVRAQRHHALTSIGTLPRLELVWRRDDTNYILAIPATLSPISNNGCNGSLALIRLGPGFTIDGTNCQIARSWRHARSCTVELVEEIGHYCPLNARAAAP